MLAWLARAGDQLFHGGLLVKQGPILTVAFFFEVFFGDKS